MKQSPIMMIGIAVIAVGIGFFSGVQYQKSQRPSFGNGQFQRVNGPSGAQGMLRGNRMGGQPVSGEITSVDDTGVTVKMRDGSSKIVILSANTVINKAVQGSKTDLTKGIQIMAVGTTNTDGSVTAQTVTIGGGMFGGPSGSGSAQPKEAR